MRECQRQKSDGTERRNHQAYGHNTPAIVTVGNRSRNKDQKKGRQKLEKTDQAEIKALPVTSYICHPTETLTICMAKAEKTGR